MDQRTAQRMIAMPLAWLIASSMIVSTATAQTAKGEHAAAGEHKASPYHAVSVSNRAKEYYVSVWGVDNFQVRRTASDNLVRFSYRVTDPARAKVLGDKRATPRMVDQRSRAVLQVPVMEKVGQLRQASAPEAGKEYWMVFSNKGNLVKAGDRVNVSIGAFRVDGLIVE